MEFGLYVRSHQTYPKMLEAAQLADELGYYGLYLNDHVIGFGDEGMEPYLEAWTAMTGLGMQTKRIKVGHIVLFNSLRNPAFLAKSAATLDVMTNGRFDLMIGSGWNEKEYVGYDLMEQGRGMPSAKERVDRFEESVKILNLMLSQEKVDYDGDFWKLKGAINVPQPVQRPMRLTVGCSKPRMMGITARYATGINLAARGITDTIDALDRFKKIHAKNAQAHDIVPLEKFEISGFSGVRIARNEAELDEMASEVAESMKKSKEEIIKEAYIGTSEMLIEKFRKMSDLGMFMIVAAPVLHKSNEANPLSYFKDEVISQL